VQPFALKYLGINYKNNNMQIHILISLIIVD
jgi:hypothetical protein